jgi:hypothetical protein
MGRRQNHLKTVPTTIATTDVQRAYLATLVKTGLYGKNEADAAERLVSGGLERLIQDGMIQLLKKEGARELRLVRKVRPRATKTRRT